jgi:hypothetical protein
VPHAPQAPGAAPPRRTILRATAAALAIAAALLLTIVLPAEYGIDPVGTGRALGLLQLAEAPAAIPVGARAGGPLAGHSGRYRVDRRELTVPSLGSVEFKYELPQGAAMVYSWRATAPVDFDFHTEPAGRPESASETFERGEAQEKSGSYMAPYDGIHGWYWENLYDTDVVVTLDAAGFFSEARLFLPNRPAERIPLSNGSTSAPTP